MGTVFGCLHINQYTHNSRTQRPLKTSKSYTDSAILLRMKILMLVTMFAFVMAGLPTHAEEQAKVEDRRLGNHGGEMHQEITLLYVLMEGIYMAHFGNREDFEWIYTNFYRWNRKGSKEYPYYNIDDKAFDIISNHFLPRDIRKRG